MTDTSPDVVTIERAFNHDLLLLKEDQDRATRRWPFLASVLVNPELIREFRPHEDQARALKRLVQITGSAAVAMMLAALLGYIAELLGAGHPGPYEIPRLAELSELSAVAALVLALLASRYGPLRRRWLKHRFVTEVLRQWHFRRLLEGSTIPHGDAARSPVALPLRESVSAFMSNLAGAVGSKMNELAELRRDPLGSIPRTSLPRNADVRAQLLEAYRVLRLDHQRDFAIYKLSVDDRTFAGLSLLALSRLSDQLAGATLVLALGCSIARLFIPFDWAPIAGASLAMTGVAVRVWRDGLALDSERERYQEMAHELELLTDRWNQAESDEQRFRVAEEVERAALEELRTFIRSQEQAQFLF